MPITNGQVVKPVSMGDISTAVHNSSLDLGTLIRDGDINKWSKHKPVILDYAGELSDANYKTANYGFGSGFVDGTTVFTSKNALRTGFTSKWTYYRPTEGRANNEWFRMLDFDGYVPSESGWAINTWTDAAGIVHVDAPFDAYIEAKSSLGNGNYINFGISPDSSGAANGLLSLSDFSGLTGFFNFGTWYFGIALISKTNSNNDRYYVLSDKVDHIISEQTTITSSVPNDNYYIVPILASAHTSNAWSSNFPTKVVTLDGCYGEITKTSAASGFEWNIVGSPTISGGNLVITVEFKNNTGTAVTVNRLFSYTMADEAYEWDSNIAFTEACEYWADNHSEKTNGAGIKVNNVVVAVYKQLATNLTINAGATRSITYTVTSGTTDAQGYAYDDVSTIGLCINYNTSNYLYKIR